MVSEQIFNALTFFAIFFAYGEIVILIFCAYNKYGKSEIGIFTLALLFRIILSYFYGVYFGTHADTGAYYTYAENQGFHWNTFLVPGTLFVYNLSAILVWLISFCDIGFLMLFIPFSLIAFIGSLLFYNILKHLQGAGNRSIVLLSFFLPNMIFWTSMIGKDAIIYFGLVLVIYGLIKSKGFSRIGIVFSAAVITYMVRPHVLLFLIVGFVLGFFMDRYKFKAQSIVIYIISIITFFFLYDSILQFAHIKPVAESENVVKDNYDSGMKYVQEKAQDVNYGGSAAKNTKINVAKAPLYIIQFIGGPFLWQSRKIMQFVSALESLIYQGIIIFIIINYKYFLKSRLQYKYSYVMYVIIASVLLGMAYTNYGLAIRQKCMVIPFVLIILVITNTEKLKSKFEAKQQVRYSAPMIN